MRCWKMVVGFCILSAAACRTQVGTQADLENPDQLTLYSIDGRWPEGGGPDHDCGPGALELERAGPGYGPPGGVTITEHFRGYPVLGKVEVTDPQERKRIAATLKASLGSEDKMSKCFCPRHAVRFTQKGHTFEYLICFQCSDFSEYVDGEHGRWGGFDPSVKATFNQPLVDAGIPIAP